MSRMLLNNDIVLVMCDGADGVTPTTVILGVPVGTEKIAQKGLYFDFPETNEPYKLCRVQYCNMVLYEKY